MSDELLLKLVSQVGEISGSMKEVQRGQQETNRRVAVLLEKHDGRIDSLEGDRHKAKGFAIGAGMFSGGTAGAALLALSKIIGGH